MALLTIEQLFRPASSAEVKTKLYELAEGLGLPVTSWLAGAPTRTLIAIVSTFYGSFVSPLIVLAAKSGFSGDATGDALTIVAKRVYGVDRREATYASTTVLVSNTLGGDYTSPGFEPGDVVFLNSATNITWRNTEAFGIGPLQASVPVSVSADVIGTAGNTAPGEIDTLVTSALGLTVTNPDAATGQDAESDADLHQRDMDSLGALSPLGPADAIRYVALTPALNGGANINRIKMLPARGDGTLAVVVASPDGTPTAGDVLLVEAGLLAYAIRETDTLLLEGAGEESIAVAPTVYVSSSAGLTDSEWSVLITDTLVAWVAALPIGGVELVPASGFVFWRAIVGVIERIQVETNGPHYVIQATLASEADIPIGSTDVAKLAAVDVTVTVVQVAT
jgi:hypothetical protein